MSDDPDYRQGSGGVHEVDSARALCAELDDVLASGVLDHERWLLACDLWQRIGSHLGCAEALSDPLSVPDALLPF